MKYQGTSDRDLRRSIRTATGLSRTRPGLVTVGASAALLGVAALATVTFATDGQTTTLADPVSTSRVSPPRTPQAAGSALGDGASSGTTSATAEATTAAPALATRSAPPTGAAPTTAPRSAPTDPAPRTTTPAQQQPALPPAGTYKGSITTASSAVGDNTYLDVSNGQSGNGTVVDTATWDDNAYDDNQIWTVVVRSDGTAVFIPQNATGAYLTWLHASPENVGGIWQQSAAPQSGSINDNQYWKLVASGGGYELITPSDGECLTAAWPGPTQFAGATYLAACTSGNSSQVWRLPS